MPQAHDLVLILARGLASAIATPMVLHDQEGNIVYFNEPAEHFLGGSFAELGEIPRDKWLDMFYPSDPDSGERISPEGLPIVIALSKQVPAHRALRITGLDGTARTIAVTAFPLWARTDEFVGAVSIFWEDEG